MLSIRPLTSRLFARITGRHIFDEAELVREIAPAAAWEVRPTISLPNEVDRIVRHHPVSIAANNLSLVHDTLIKQGPTRAHLLRDVVIASGALMTTRACDTISSERRQAILHRPLDQIAAGAFCSTTMTERYFGHWLMDGLSHELLASDIESSPLSFAGSNRAHEPGYREILAMQTHEVSFAKVQRLWVLQDCELNQNRAARLRRIRARLGNAAVDEGHSHVFISRGSTGVGRTLVNEMELCEVLSKRGFNIIEPEVMSAKAIAQELHRARIIISVEGSAIAHAMLACPQGAGLLVIQPPRHFNMIWRTYCGIFGMPFAFTVGTAVASESFHQPIGRLMDSIDLLEREIATA